MVNNLDEVYAALADASRRVMVERLAGGSLSVSELGKPLQMTLAAVGKHVSVLESAGIITTSKTGRVRRCALSAGSLSAANSWLVEQQRAWNQRLDALEAHLEEQP